MGEGDVTELAEVEPASLADDAERTPGEAFLERILKAHEVWYDVTRGFTHGGRTFPGFAAFHQQGERYVLSKRAKLWGVANHEYIFFDVTDRLEEGALESYVSYMKTEALKLVDPTEPDHMSSDLSLVLVTGSIDDGVERAVRKVRFRKNYKMGLAGWSDLRIAVVDLASGKNGRVITNAAGKRLKATLEANLAPAQSVK